MPSAIDHRPLRFEELETALGWKAIDEVKLDEAAAQLELVSDAHQQVLANKNQILEEKEVQNSDFSSLINVQARKNNHRETLQRKVKT